MNTYRGHSAPCIRLLGTFDSTLTQSREGTLRRLAREVLDWGTRPSKGEKREGKKRKEKVEREKERESKKKKRKIEKRE